MSIGILGKKLGMSQFFDDEGRSIPVTVIEAGPCRIHHFEDEPEPTSGKLSLHNYKHAGFLEFNNVSLQHVYGIGQSDCM